MPFEPKELKDLLSKTQRIVNHQKEIARLKGENFNLFSILGMESAENKTHSAFLGELLNPRGSHEMGSVFLEYFLESIQQDKYVESNFLDAASTTVILEKSIGTRDDEAKTGGRVDIFLQDQQEHNLLIENKLYASDQNVQIERYANYKKSTSKVIYLTLDGKDPSGKSRGTLVADDDYCNMSYGNEIVHWLERCQKEAVDRPVVRESIKQYLILIKKLTGTMDEQPTNELNDIILNNFEAAEYVVHNYAQLKQELGEDIREKVHQALVLALGNNYHVSKGRGTNTKFAQLWIELKAYKDVEKLYFGLESFSGNRTANFKGALFIGVCGHGSIAFKPNDDYTSHSAFWKDHQFIQSNVDEEFNLSNPETIKKLTNDSAYKVDFVKEIVKQSVKYIEERAPDLETWYAENFIKPEAKPTP